MRRFGSSQSGCCFSFHRSRLSSLPQISSPSHVSRRSVVDGKPPWGILRLARAVSLLRRPCSIKQPKHLFHTTGLTCAAERDYYKILGVSNNAGEDDIRKAFRALAKKYHPDSNRNNPSAKRKLREIREAYETLRDLNKRARYHQESFGYPNQGRHASYPSGFDNYNQHPFSNTFYDIFSEIFQDEREIFATDIEVELSLSFMEAVRGCTKELKFSSDVPCESCSGSGHPVNAKPQTCSTCDGSGTVTIIPFSSKCTACKGLGQVIKEHCVTCGGAGVLKSIKNVDVSIPAGLSSGDTIRVPRAGNSGRRGVHPGSLFIKLKVGKDPVFSRDGADIYVDCNITFTQAILGGKVVIPTLFENMKLKIPTGVQPGQLLILRGKGLPKRIGFVDHGDQYVRFRVQFPLSLNERQKFLLEEFSREEEIVENNGYAGENG